ncbi:MAG: hypothetical protein CMJ89_06895 [Planctomycetes bacterium]|nr:hypothetical protein [Planctomycetota bacterium]
MTTTLIVRDATLVINGAPEKRKNPGLHLPRRLSEVEGMEIGLVEECAEVLLTAAGGEESAPEVLEALILIAIAHESIGARMGLTPASTGRRLAARFERAGKAENALGLLEFLVEELPGEPFIERDLAAVMRRQGVVRDLADRYFERAKSLIREGRAEEAMGWLRETLQIDRSRKDVVRLIRDLRFQEHALAQSRQVRWRFVAMALAVSLGLSFIIIREVRLLDQYRQIPEAVPGNPHSTEERLVVLESFIKANPAWHRAFHVLQERSTLRIETDRIEELRNELQQREDQKTGERLLSAEAAMYRGMTLSDGTEWRSALDEFKKALEWGGENWEHREQVQRDVEAIAEFLREGGELGQ